LEFSKELDWALKEATDGIAAELNAVEEKIKKISDRLKEYVCCLKILILTLIMKLARLDDEVRTSESLPHKRFHVLKISRSRPPRKRSHLQLH
jgi:hypothetical protein